VLYYIRLDRLASHKCSSLLGLFITSEENDVNYDTDKKLTDIIYELSQLISLKFESKGGAYLSYAPHLGKLMALPINITMGCNGPVSATKIRLSLLGTNTLAYMPLV
jgi:hypothetical protein